MTTNAYTRHQGTINRRLTNLFHIIKPPPNLLHVTTSDIHVDPSRHLWFRLFNPAYDHTANSSLPLIVYIHGGGFSKHGPDTASFHRLCSHLAARVPAVVASVSYRLAPQHKYPTQYDDVYDVLRVIDAQTASVLPAYTDTRRCFVAGDSAGANIGHHVTIRALNNAGQFTSIVIAGVVAVQPFFGGEERTESEQRLRGAPFSNVDRTDKMWRDFLPEGADRNHPAAHVFGGGSSREVKNLENYPTTLVIMGGYDPLQDWQRRYVEWLKNCGKEVEVTMYHNAIHAFNSFPELPEFDFLIERVTRFIQRGVRSPIEIGEVASIMVGNTTPAQL